MVENVQDLPWDGEFFKVIGDKPTDGKRSRSCPRRERQLRGGPRQKKG